jgi:alkyldihydroxyacetonephosphate synthase
MAARRSFWGWGLETDEPSSDERAAHAARLSKRYNTTIEAPPIPTVADLDLRKPRVEAPAALAGFCTTETHDRASHAYGKSFRDTVRAFNRKFPNLPDVVAYPRTEAEVIAALEWCGQGNIVAIPYGGGSSVVGGVEPPDDGRPSVSIDLARLDRVLELDETSRAARIQAGVLGPALEDQLRPKGYTLRHFPQSFEWSTLGGWLATRSGGHYATNHTHIDDFVESIRMVTPKGVWESRRLPGSGAGPSPDRMILGSEGILGIITEAWMRIQARPRFRASVGVTFDSFEAGYTACRRVVQAKLWPANCRLLDPVEAGNAAGLQGNEALLIIAFESAELPQDRPIWQAVEIARECGGRIDDEAVKVSDGSEEGVGRQGAVGAWRNSFVTAPYNRNLTAGMGIVGDTFETAITWDRWPAFHADVSAKMRTALDRVCGGGTLSVRFTHVYPDGPAPYYSFNGLGRRGAEIEMWTELKTIASDAVMANGGTITHHHAVGRDHRPWYDIQRPPVFTEALRAAKRAVDPQAILNPGVLIDP